MGSLGTRKGPTFSSSAGLRVGLHDFKALFQPKQSYDFNSQNSQALFMFRWNFLCASIKAKVF